MRDFWSEIYHDVIYSEREEEGREGGGLVVCLEKKKKVRELINIYVADVFF